MKILLISQSDSNGGANIAAMRLHEALINSNFDSTFLVQDKSLTNSTLTNIEYLGTKFMSKIRKIIDYIPTKMMKTKSMFSLSLVSNSSLLRKVKKIDPDLVHIHWINGGLLKIEDLGKINKPIIWSMHDMWAFTGGCHYTQSCRLYATTCNRCPIIKSSKSGDISNWLFKRKFRVYNQIKDLTIIGLSKWIYNCALDSALLKNHKHKNLPNTINTDIYKTLEKESCKKIFNLPLDKKIILFGAIDFKKDFRKGFNSFYKAISNFNDKNFELVLLTKEKLDLSFNLKTHFIEPIHEENLLVKLYNAADLTVITSLQENLSNTIMESLSCGTPVLSFKIGGNVDLVEHKKNGYLANPNDVIDLKNGINWIINNNSDKELSMYARKKILENFRYDIVAKKYFTLYSNILQNYKI